jgi:4-amino-4-deoxy-L-arabinose transferase-like glycosyltransferase
MGALPTVRIWREAEFWLVTLLVVGIYFTRLTALPIHGEEPRWAQVAYEMLQSGDWVVPRQQGEPFPDRPPLNSWLIALSSLLIGEWSPLAVRLPSVFATLLTTWLVYWYSRHFMTRIGSLAAGAGYATMGLVLDLGRLAESDNLLTLFISSSLMIWHIGYVRRWPALITWTTGFSLAALAALTKGPQGPVYFAGCIGVFLLLVRRDWRYLVDWRVAVGLAAFLLIVGAWQVPFYLALDWRSVMAVWSEEGTIGTRFDYSQLGPVVWHWFTYPIKVFVCLLPWSTMAACYLVPDFRRSLGAARPYVAFLMTCALVALPTCWFPADSIPHYYLGLFPCIAPLFGLAIERCWAADKSRWWQWGWSRFLRGSALVIVASGLFIGVISFFPDLTTLRLKQGTWFAIFYMLVAGGAAVTLWRNCRSRSPAAARIAILTLAGFLGLSHTGVVINGRLSRVNQTPGDIARVKQLLPPGTRLVSFGKLHHRFTYYYQDLIELRNWPTSAADVDPSIVYFCLPRTPGGYATRGADAPPEQTDLPFEWDELAVVSCDRCRRPVPNNAVVIGRRRQANEIMADRAKPAKR